MVSLLLPHAVRRERATRALNAPFLHLFIASALMYGAIAASSFQSASPPGSSEFYENIDVDTLDDSDEVIGSDGTLKETSADIHDILELIEDGRLYPVLSKDENQYMPSTSTSKNTGEYLPTTHSKDERKKDTNTLFLDDFEQSAKKRRKRNEQVFMQDKGAKFKPNFIEKDNINISKVKMLITPKNTVKLSKAIPKQNIVEFINFIKNNHTHINSDQITERNKQSIKENNKLLSEEIRNKREVTNPGLNKTTGESSSQVKEKRVKTGDTILNIKGAVRDSIGDAVAGGAEGASVLDAIVIHPSQYLRDAPAANNYTDRTPTETGSVRTTGAAGAAGAAGERQLLAERRSRVRLDCDLPANISVAEWVKDGEPQNLAPGAATGATVWWAEESSGAAVVGRAGRGEAGEWRCAGYDHNGDKVYGQPLILTVYEESRLPYLELDGRRLDPGNTWVPVETGVVLEVLCIAEGGVPAPELTWRLVGSSLGRPGSGGSARELRRLLRATPANYTQAGLSSSVARVSVTSALHNASLECDATQPRPEPRHPRTATARLLVHVTYPPSFVISRYPGFGVALWTGGQAALRCDVDSNPRVRAWWVRDEDELVPSSSPPPADAPDGEPSRAILSWISLTLQNAGWYRCRAKWNGQEYSSIGYFLIVRPASERPPAPSAPAAAAPRPPVQHVEVPLGGSVQVHCPKGSVGCWGRRMIGDNRSELWTQAGSARAHGVLGIRGALYQEGGEYRCMGASAEDEQQLRELKRITLTVTGSPTATAVGAAPLSGGGRRLSCVACGRGVRVRWLLLPGGVLAPGDVTPLARAARLQPDPLAPRCALATLELAGGGEVWCAAAGEGGGALAVFPAPPHAPPHSPPRALASAAARAPAPPPRTAAPLALLLLLASCNVT